MKLSLLQLGRLVNSNRLLNNENGYPDLIIELSAEAMLRRYRARVSMEGTEFFTWLFISVSNMARTLGVKT